MSTFGGRIRDLENVLVDNFLSCESHTCFFLSHCHADHMAGLGQLFLTKSDAPDQYLYCSPISRLILLNQYSTASGNFIKELTSTKVITVPANAAAPSYQVTVTPIPAGHCPGSIMFLFETVNTSILYTGDFRILKDDINKFKCLHNKSLVKSVDKLYLDSTFLSDVYWEFPSRSEALTDLLALTVSWTKQSPQHNVLLETCALYGYEYVFVELARKLKCKIHVKDLFHDIFWNVPEVGSYMTKDCASTKIHAFGAFGKKCVPLEPEKLLRIRLSAQWYKSTKGNKRDKIWKEVSKGKILMCYSNHCSCSELVSFLNYLQPIEVEPCCVAVGSTEEDVNISASWFLPEDGFPVFYRYFDDKVTWDDAYAACGSHQADLLSVQTTAQMDAARAYLKEVDSADNVWIGLLREPSDETFSWTNGEKLLGDGYWMEPIPQSSEKLCVAMDPAADFRWSSHYCRGPKVASFVCELAVPEWAKKENGCLTSPLPSLTVTLVPEAAVIQLLSDCGLDGTRRIACNQETNREDIIKHLSCEVDTFASTVLAGSSTAGAPRQNYNRVSPHDITRSYRPLTRHRRSAPPTSPITPHTPPQNQTTPPTDEPSSQPPTSDSNAPPTSPPLPSTGNSPVYKPLPVLLITNDDPPPDNGSLPLPAPDNPPIVLMIDNQNLDGPFLFPLADDIIINNPSLSPLQVISVDLVEVDNLAANNTDNLTTPVTPPPPPAPIKLPSNSPLPPTTPRPTIGAAEENPQDDKTDVPQRRSRGRLFDHLTRFSYPRLLNRVLG